VIKAILLNNFLEDSMTSKELALKFVLSHEKYCGRDLGDGAGLTIWGITEKWFMEDVKKMKAMGVDDARKYAKDIVYSRLWDECGCDEIAHPLNVIHFDTDVLMGRDDSRKMLRNSTGPNTYLIMRFHKIATMRNSGSHVAIKNFGGWINRTLDLVELILG